MKHRFLPNLPLYLQCKSCGFVYETPDRLSLCPACKQEMSAYEWFPNFIYDYVIMLEDYHLHSPTQMRQDYFKAVKADNWMEYWCSVTSPKYFPSEDLKPITILLFRSIFEALLAHFLWKKIWVSLLPSPDAERYADLVLNNEQSVSKRLFNIYPRVTGNKWINDLNRMGYSSLNKLLQDTARIRNEFIHENPHAGYHLNVGNQARQSIPILFACFVNLANLYIHPRCLQLRKLKWEYES